MTPIIEKLYRYPVKGLSPEPLHSVTVEINCCLPHDRRFALARSDSTFDPAQPTHVPKSNFFMLMRDERLAELSTRYFASSGRFMITREDQSLVDANLLTPEGRAEVERFFAEFLGDTPGAPPRLVEAPGHTFSDARRRPNAKTGQYLSIVNLGSITDLSMRTGFDLDPLRFRANIYLSGLHDWDELAWVDDHLILGETLVHVVSPITRCAATAVNPVTARRDVDVPQELMKHYGHNHMGVYVEVLRGGQIAVGDTIESITPSGV